ncbi:hypothetical protein BS50DRAFT_195981 [Corynespora cassiicola Philippines]|uniref:Uncharacterized protein n=1 Tax=Corynespora cassiicola Philippines TaxID=1448308 RepID=A0A2T2P810_CORCC|nr:hypothetical protein BS50DRAFT_195981 [Corynespora cassiicola Philippines]
MCARERETSILKWLEDFPCDRQNPSLTSAEPLTPLSLRSGPSTPTLSGKRKRGRSMPEPRSHSPQKRQRRLPDDDDIFPDQSASDMGVTELSERTKLSRPSQSAGSSPKRATSPVRDLLNDLRVSKPSVLCEIPSSVTLPERAAALQRRLMDELEERLIPASLKVMGPVSLRTHSMTSDKQYSAASNSCDISFCSGDHSNLSVRRLRYAISR